MIFGGLKLIISEDCPSNNCRGLIDSLKMKSFLANVRYTAVPVLSNMIKSIPSREEQILWVGCSDSHIDETDVLDVPRQELFVHRNLGNKLSNGDTSSLGAIEFCVKNIEVRFHVAICMDIIRLTIFAGQACDHMRTLWVWLDQ